MNAKNICRYYNVLMTINEKIREIEGILEDLKNGVYEDEMTFRTARACIETYEAALVDHRDFKKELIAKIQAECEKEG